MGEQQEVRLDIGALIECERRIEGVISLVGVLADANGSAELEIITDVLIGTADDMRRALNLHRDEDVG